MNTRHRTNVIKCFNAIANHDYDTLRKMLSRGVDVNIIVDTSLADESENIVYRTLLNMAVFHENPVTVQILLEMGADVNVHARCDHAPLHVVCMNANVQIAAMLLDADGVDMNILDSYGSTPIKYAIESGHANIVSLFIDRHYNIDMPDLDGDTVLQMAVRNGKQDIVELLISKNANLNVVTKGRTPLHMAVHNRDVAITTLLVDNNANIHATMSDGNALFEAVSVNSTEIVRFLIERGVCVNIMNIVHESPLHRACLLQNLDVVNLLISNGADVNAIDGGTGKTPIYKAICCDSFQLVSLLIEHGACIHCVDLFSDTPLHAAAQNAGPDVCMLLLDKKADINARNDEGKTPLHCAIEEVNIDTIQTLIANSTLVDYFTNNGETALHMAVELEKAHSHSITKALLEKQADLNSIIQNFTPLEDAYHNRSRRTVRLLLQFHTNDIRCPSNMQFRDTTRFDEFGMIKILISMRIHDHYAEKIGLITSQQTTLSTKRYNGLTPLHYALFLKMTSLAEHLLNFCVSLDVPDIDGRSLLHYAVYCRELSVAELLLKMGIARNLPDRYEHTAMIVAINLKNEDAVHLLLKYDCELPQDLYALIQRSAKMKKMFNTSYLGVFTFLTPSDDEERQGQNNVVLLKDTANLIVSKCNQLSMYNTQVLRDYLSQRREVHKQVNL